MKQCREAGMSDFLPKPLRKAAMVAAILRAIGSSEGRLRSPAEPAVSAAPLDRSALAQLTEAIGKDGVRQAFAVFLRETEARLALFERFREGDDRQKIEIEAHALKGSAGALGGREVSDIARSIEHRAARISADELHGAVERLDEAYRRMRREFEADRVKVA